MNCHIVHFCNDLRQFKLNFTLNFTLGNNRLKLEKFKKTDFTQTKNKKFDNLIICELWIATSPRKDQEMSCTTCFKSTESSKLLKEKKHFHPLIAYR